jgi:hypothetical protein
MDENRGENGLADNNTNNNNNTVKKQVIYYIQFISFPYSEAISHDF